MIFTKRTILKSLSIKDGKDLYSYRSLPEIYKYQSWLPKTIHDAEEFIRTYSLNPEITEGHWKQFGIYLIHDNSLIGDCGFCLLPKAQAEIGYTISPSLQRKGLGREVAQSLVGFLFEKMSILKIIAKTDPENIGSIKILETIGFLKESHFKQSIKIRGEWKDDLVYAILHDELAKSV